MPLPTSSASGARSKKATPITAPAEKPMATGSRDLSFRANRPPIMVAVQAPAARARIRRGFTRPDLSRRAFRSKVGKLGMGLIHRDYVPAHFDDMVMAPQDDAGHRRDGAVVAAPRRCDMAFADD